MRYAAGFLGSLLVLGAAWEAAARWGGLDARLYGSPSALARVLVADLASGELQRHFHQSLLELALGYGLAALLGIPLGMVLGSRRTLELAFSPYLQALYSTPSQAWQPLLIMALGLGLTSQVVLVFLFAFSVIVLTVMAGVRSVDPLLVRVGRVFGANRWELFTKIVLPSLLPYIVAGLRLGVGRAVIGVFLAEFFGASAGLGYYIVRSGTALQMDRVLLGVLLLVGISVVLTEGIRVAEERLTPWRPPRRL